MQMEVLNPGQSAPVIVDVNAEAPNRPVDAHRYSTFNFTGRIEVPVRPYARIFLSEDGQYYFRGYVYYMKRQGEKITIQCRGEEELAWHRYSPRHGWTGSGSQTLGASEIRITHIFEDGAPSQTPDYWSVVHNSGAIFLMNSAIPQTIWPVYNVTYPNWCFKLVGGGTNSRLGTAPIYVEGLYFPRKGSISECLANLNSAYADALDLYIQFDWTTYMASYFLHISALNAFDTGIRRGNIDHDAASIPIDGNIQMNVNCWGDFLVNLAETLGLTPHWRYEADHTYFDAINEAP